MKAITIVKESVKRNQHVDVVEQFEKSLEDLKAGRVKKVR